MLPGGLLETIPDTSTDPSRWREIPSECVGLRLSPVAAGRPLTSELRAKTPGAASLTLWMYLITGNHTDLTSMKLFTPKMLLRRTPVSLTEEVSGCQAVGIWIYWQMLILTILNLSLGYVLSFLKHGLHLFYFIFFFQKFFIF